MNAFKKCVIVGILLTISLLAVPPSPAHADEDGWIIPANCVEKGYYYEPYAQWGGEIHHTGVDLGCNYGYPVVASNSGTALVISGWNQYPGISVFISDEPAGEWSFYTHLSSASVKTGEKVKQGETIGKVGSAGTGPHLHWGRTNVDPNSSFWTTYELHASENGGKGWLDPKQRLSGSPMPPSNIYIEEEESLVEKIPAVDFKKILLWGLGGIIVSIFIATLMYFFRPKKTAAVLVHLANNAPLYKRAMYHARREALQWWVFTITIAIVFTPEIREAINRGFLSFFQSTTTVENWKIVACGLSLILNLILRSKKKALKEREKYHGKLPIAKRIKKSALMGKITIIVVTVFVLAGVLFIGTPALIKTVVLNPQYVTYAGIYGHLGPGGWGTLSEFTSGEEAAQAAKVYADQVDSFNGTRFTVPIVNMTAVDEEDADIQKVIDACSPYRCVVQIDTTPNENVEALIKKWGFYPNVWIDVDLEHAGTPTSAQQFNSWAKQYFALRAKSGVIMPGVFAFYDFQSDPWLTPASDIQWEYPNGYVIPIFDGGCMGAAKEQCKDIKWNATTRVLQSYETDKIGIMEFITRWGCGSIYGDCGFGLDEYYQDFLPLIYMSQ